MKRFLVVLTILVLVAGFAFAESQISGKVTAAYTFNFADSAKSAGYAVKGSNAKLEWTWNSHTVGPYEGNKPYATVTVGLSLGSEIAENKAAAWKYDKYEASISVESFTGKLTLKEAKIVGEDWSIDLLKAAMYGEYAKSAWDYTVEFKATEIKNYKPYSFDNSNGGKKNGITVAYKDYTVGIALNELNWIGAAKYTLDVSTQSPVFKFDGGSAQVAGIVGFDKTGNETVFTFSLSAKADYAIDAFSASAAVDTRLDANEKFNFDVAAKFAYAPATLDFYYASLMNAPDKIGSADVECDYEKYMSLRVSVDVAKIAENVPVKAYVGLKDVLNKSFGRELLAGAEYDGEKIDAEASSAYEFESKLFVIGATAKFADLVEGFGVEAGITVAKDEEAGFGGKVGVTYTAEKFDAAADLIIFKAPEDDALFGFKATVESTKLVENAKLFASLVLDKEGAVFGYNVLEMLRNVAVAGSVIDPETIPGLEQTLTIGCEIAF